MAATHISEAEAAADLPALLNRVRAGEEIVIERDHYPVAVLHAATFPRRTVSEALALARQRTLQRGGSPVMDEDFAQDMLQIIANRKPRHPSAWD